MCSVREFADSAKNDDEVAESDTWAHGSPEQAARRNCGQMTSLVRNASDTARVVTKRGMCKKTTGVSVDTPVASEEVGDYSPELLIVSKRSLAFRSWSRVKLDDWKARYSPQAISTP